MQDDESIIKREPANKADACVIWLHGLGADGHDFAAVVDALNLPESHGIRFIFPHAPVRPVTINNGMVMRAWYDIFSLDSDMQEDEQGIRASQAIVDGLIKDQIDLGIPANRILLCGFSQGGCIAVHAGLRYQQPLAGIMGLSCYLPLRQLLTDEWHTCQKSTQFILMHGTEDTVVGHHLGRMSYAALKDLGLNISWMDYPMEHTVCNRQLQDISLFIHTCLPLTD